LGWLNAGWPPSSSADAVISAIARDAGIARRALLGLSSTIRIPIPPPARKLGTRAAGVNAWQIALRGAIGQAKAADCGANEAG
jgi:hypothetical protein